ncbi:MAG TPA: crotonase, partial [Gammaproteobacteria bacterium]|nr:crotonase [Gammaproteobacteria bacterium]
MNAARKHRHWHVETDADGIAWLHLDKADSDTNVLSREVLLELDDLLDELTRKPPRGVIFVSDKPGGFIAGADVQEFTQLQTEDEALEAIRRGQGIMDRIEALPCPTVAVLHGFALGGGLELALACDYRVAEDDPGTKLGLPEIRLGIHPGFGGTVRSIERLGVLQA